MSLLNRPQLIVLTPVRNEAWVLKAFLTCTSLWADHIIIADQMSTDGSREIYKDFPKVQVIDNNRQEMHQAATRGLLFDAAREYLQGDTNAILFALDADEFLAGDFIQSESWNRILNSKPGDIFLWSWMFLKGDDVSLFSTTLPYYWGAHVSNDLWGGEFPNNAIHEWRLPWPQGKDYSFGEKLLDFYSIHLSRVNTLRQQNKSRFYQVSSLAQKNKKYTSVSLYRQYHTHEQTIWYDTPADAYDYYLQNGIDIWSLVNLTDDSHFHTTEILRYFKRDGLRKYALLDIWDEDWCRKNNIISPQKWYHKMFMNWLKWSNKYADSIPIRAIDKFCKWCFSSKNK